MSRKRHPLWAVWHGMKQRCSNKNRSDYKYYGGKGVNVCDEWQSLSGFVASVGERPSKNHTIDRIDPAGDYCPDNCRWATKKEQALNSSHCIVIEGKSLSDWARELGVGIACASKRYAKYGREGLEKSFVPGGIRFNGEMKTIKDWAAFVGISPSALSKRIELWGVDRALTTPKYHTRRQNQNWRRK
ncbi:hypothetical protein N9937_02045 [bacterium]|nr:hypothetical protein [bacterium]